MNLPESFFTGNPWDLPSHPILCGASFTLQRNLASTAFPSKLTYQEASNLVEILKYSFSHLEKTSYFFLSGEDITPENSTLINEHFLDHNDWQHLGKEQALFFSPNFLALVNDKNHISLQQIDTQRDWKKTLEDLLKIESKLNLDYAFSSKFGYHTAHPQQSGTALSLVSYLHLPCLIHSGTLLPLLTREEDLAVKTTGLLGNLEELIGSFLLVKNKYTLGISEDSILSHVENMTQKLILEEEMLRESYKKELPSLLKDSIGRSYGLLKHSNELETKETINALGFLKLAVELDLVKGFEKQGFNSLFFEIRRGHLLKIDPSLVPNSQKIKELRAKHLQSRIKSLELDLS
jgi:protein arginine kinase